MTTKYYIDTEFEEEEYPASTKMNTFNDKIKASFQLVSNALVDMTGDDKVIDDVDRSDEMKVTASSPSDMNVHIAVGLACVDGQVCQVDAPVTKTIVPPTNNPRYTIIQVDEDGNVETIDGSEAASPVEPSADADAMKIAAIYLPANCTQIDDSDIGNGYIIDRREFPTVILSGGKVGINTTGPDAQLDVLSTSGAQLRLTHTDGTKYVDFTLDTNHDLTIKPSSSGQIKLQPATDSLDFFQVLDANGGTPILNIDSDNERISIKKSDPDYDFDMAGSMKISGQLGVGMGPTDTIGASIVLSGEGKTQVLRIGNPHIAGAGVGTRVLLNAGVGLASMAYIDAAFEGANDDDAYFAIHTRKSDVLSEQVRITSDGYVGVNTTGPDRKLDVLDNSNPQLRLTHTDGSIYTDIQTDSSGYLIIDCTGNRTGVETSNPLTALTVNGAISLGDPSSIIPQLSGDALEGSNTRLIIQPTSGNQQINAFFIPSGTNTASSFQIRNASDLSNFGRFYSKIDGAAIEIGGNGVGSGTAPTSLSIGLGVWGSINDLVIASSDISMNKPLEVLYSSDKQLRLTHTEGSVYADFQTTSAGNIVISPTGYTVLSSSKGTTGDPTGVEGMIYINTTDKAVRMYADSAWRTLASW